MRKYAQISPRFWNGETGKKIRSLGAHCQVTALYILTAPNATMTGLYYLPVPTISHETGIPIEGAWKALRSLCAISPRSFCSYDEVEEVVWVPTMARHQVGDELKPKDKRIKGVINTLEPYRRSRFLPEFVALYGKAFRLPSEFLARASEGASHAPSNPLRSQEQDQEQEKDLQHSLSRERGHDAFLALADAVWSEQEAALAALRREGIGSETRPLGLMHAGKAKLVQRISERALAADLASAEADVRYALQVWLDEARRKRTLRWFDGDHWSSERFSKALVRAIGEADVYRAPALPARTPRVGRVEPLDAEAYNRAAADGSDL